MATIAFVTEEGAAHQAPYREAINSIAGIDRALLMDPGGTTLGGISARVRGQGAGRRDVGGGAAPATAPQTWRSCR